jgi:hypothetical protein
LRQNDEIRTIASSPVQYTKSTLFDL